MIVPAVTLNWWSHERHCQTGRPRSASTFVSPQRTQHTPAGHRIFSSASRHLSSQLYWSIRETRLIPSWPGTPRKRKRLLPKDIAQRPDREIMTRIFGKRIMRAVDKLVKERSDDANGLTH